LVYRIGVDDEIFVDIGDAEHQVRSPEGMRGRFR
jgi:hypothetical protein